MFQSGENLSNTRSTGPGEGELSCTMRWQKNDHWIEILKMPKYSLISERPFKKMTVYQNGRAVSRWA